jgi:DNA-directed RNA polymerase subunit RPC12/RpoP
VIDLQYILEVSPRLALFKKKSQNLYNFRCPYCGDSAKKRSKARGYFYRVKRDMFYKCHNCGEGKTVGSFLKDIDAELHKRYIVDRYKGSVSTNVKEPEFNFKPVVFPDQSLKGLTRFDKLEKDHPAHQFITKRHLSQFLDRLYFCPKFYTWVNSLIPNKFDQKLVTSADHPRVVLSFLGADNKMFAFQGRAFGKENPKYITIKLDEKKKKIFGLDRLNLEKHIYIVEGPIDSLFIDNCIAMAGADLELDYDKNKCTVIFDNEPRNTEILKRMKKTIDAGYSIFIWPSEITNEKDINDLVISGYTKQNIQELINDNTYSGLSAKQQFINWKKK